MAAFESEWEGRGKDGKNLGTDEELMELGDKLAGKVIRLFMMQTRVDEAVFLRDAQGAVMEELGSLTPEAARRYRVLMQKGFGLIRNVKEEDGRRWLLYMTDRGVDFANWLIQDPDGQKWGVKEKVDLSAEEKRRYEQAFILGDREEDRRAREEDGAGGGLTEIKEGIVKWRIGKWGLLLDQRVNRLVWGKIMKAVSRRGYRTVFVPDGYEVYVMEMTATGKKVHRVERWSEFPTVDRRLIMDNAEDGMADGMADEGGGESDEG